MAIVKGTGNPRGRKPPTEPPANMGGRPDVIDAGVFVDAGGRRKPARERAPPLPARTRAVTKGPFPNISAVAAGHRICRVKDLDEAIEWAKRCPNPMPGPSVIEIREMFEMGDFSEAPQFAPWPRAARGARPAGLKEGYR